MRTKKNNMILTFMIAIALLFTCIEGNSFAFVMKQPDITSELFNKNKISSYVKQTTPDPVYGEWLSLLTKNNWALSYDFNAVPASRQFLFNKMTYTSRMFNGGVLLTTENIMIYPNKSVVFLPQHSKDLMAGFSTKSTRSEIEKKYGIGYQISNVKIPHAIYIFPTYVFVFWYDNNGVIQQVSVLKQDDSDMMNKISKEYDRYTSHVKISTELQTKQRFITNGKLYINMGYGGQLIEHAATGNKNIIYESILTNGLSALLLSDNSIVLYDEQKTIACEIMGDVKSCVGDKSILKSQKTIKKIISDSSKNIIIGTLEDKTNFYLNIPFLVTTTDGASTLTVNAGAIKVSKKIPYTEAITKEIKGNPISLTGTALISTDCDALKSTANSYLYPTCEPKTASMRFTVSNQSFMKVSNQTISMIAVDYPKDLMIKLWKDHNRSAFSGTATFDSFKLIFATSSGKLKIMMTGSLTSINNTPFPVIPTTSPTTSSMPCALTSTPTITPPINPYLPPNMISPSTTCTNPVSSLNPPILPTPTVFNPYMPSIGPVATSTGTSIQTPTGGFILTTPSPSPISPGAITNPIVNALLLVNGIYSYNDTSKTVTIGTQSYSANGFNDGVFIPSEQVIIMPNQEVIFYPGHIKPIIGALTMKSKLSDFTAVLGQPVKIGTTDNNVMFMMNSGILFMYLDASGAILETSFIKSLPNGSFSFETDRRTKEKLIFSNVKTNAIFVLNNTMYIKLDETRIIEYTLPSVTLGSFVVIDNFQVIFVGNQKTIYTLNLTKLADSYLTNHSTTPVQAIFTAPADVSQFKYDTARHSVTISMINNTSFEMIFANQLLSSTDQKNTFQVTDTSFMNVNNQSVNKSILTSTSSTPSPVLGKITIKSDCDPMFATPSCVNSKFHVLFTTDSKKLPQVGQGTSMIELLMSDSELSNLYGIKMGAQMEKENMSVVINELTVQINQVTKVSTMLATKCIVN